MSNPQESKSQSTNPSWEDSRCPICMDHPHNAVQLLCSNASCTSFLCNTSPRLSNCLDRFTSTNPDLLTCPLCRGRVIGWKIDRDARSDMDLKSRSCSAENCDFEGDYEQLRCHAHKEHPLDRPGVVDQERQIQWDRLESQHELNDVLTAIRSAVPGAVVMGDYAVEPGSQEDGEPGSQDNEPGSQDNETDGNTDGGDGPGSWWTELVLFDVMGSPIVSSGAARTRSRRPSSSSSRYLWGENLLGLRYDDDVDDEVASEDDEVDDADVRHVARRRLDGDQDVHSRSRRNNSDDQESR